MQSGMEMMMSAAIKSLGLDPEEIKTKVESIGQMAKDANDKFKTMETNEALMIQILQTIVKNQEQEKLILQALVDAIKNNSIEDNDHGNDGGNHSSGQPN